MNRTNVIKQRDLDPLWSKANEIGRSYEIAGNCITAVLGADAVSVKMSNHPKALLFCSLCKRYYKYASKLPSHDYPCSDLHRKAVTEAQKHGGSYTYICPLGFFFWTSPFFFRGRFAGAFISSGFLSIEKEKAMNKIYSVCKGEISRSEISNYLDDIPEKTSSDVNMLAGMLKLCAEQISERESHKEEEAEDYKTHGNPEKIKETERHLIASLRRGDPEEAKKLITGLLKHNYNDNNTEHIQLRAIELIALISRAGASQENYKDFFELNNKFIKRIEYLQSLDEITKALCTMAELVSWKIFSFKGLRHSRALKKAERFIWDNFTRKISLGEIAGASGLSGPYFSTIFKKEIGENLSGYLNRLKIEKASALLRETDLQINEISLKCGFADQSWFSKIFKGFTGYSPSKYREER